VVVQSVAMALSGRRCTNAQGGILGSGGGHGTEAGEKGRVHNWA
jgi:hypothetical protein